MEREEFDKAKIVLETAKMSWIDLQTFFAKGQVIAVSPDLDLVEVAHAISKDQKSQVEAWMAGKQVGQVSDDQAKLWFENKTELWTVVIRPWILVQDRVD